MQKAVLILGMHRSGTSCLAGSLQQKGLHLGQVFEWNPFNLKGNRENADIMGLNDSILVYNNGKWDDPPSNIQWNTEHIVARDRIIKTFLATDVPVFGFKDPRCLFTLPFWLDGLIDVEMVGSFRHPLNVASSLENRSGMLLSDSLSLWEKYNNELLSLTLSHNIPLVNFDVEQSEYMSRIESLANYLQLPNNKDNDEIPFYDKKLISGVISKNENEMTKTVSEIYSSLLNIYHEQLRYV